MSTDIAGFWGENQDMNAIADTYSEGGKTLPPGWHDATISKTELKNTASGNGMNLFVFFDFNGIEKKECFNLKKNDGTVNSYTRPVLAKLAVSAGVRGPLVNPMALHGLRVSCKLGHEDYRTSEGKDVKVNSFLNYRGVNAAGAGAGASPFGGQPAQQDTAPAQQDTAQAQQPAQQGATSANAPW